MGEAAECFDCNCFSKVHCEPQPDDQHLVMTMEENHQHNEGTWFEEEIDDNLRWSFALNRFSQFL